MTCSFEKCPGKAIWQPVLGLQVSVKSPVLDARFHKLGFCEMHKDAAKLADFISPSCWDKITRFMAECGKPIPRRHLATLRFVIIASPESSESEQLPF